MSLPAQYETLLSRFVSENRRILGKNLIGVYLHGSAAMDCFSPEGSDLDLITVTEGGVTWEDKRALVEMIVDLNDSAPKKGLEWSLMERAACRPFVHPAPFLLHFSPGHLDRWRADPEGYIHSMQGKDPDLAAHAAVLCARGRTLYGPPISEVFDPPERGDWISSIRYDIFSAPEEIVSNPIYVILNLCRALPAARYGLALSKKEGGEWALSALPGMGGEEYLPLVRAALDAYALGKPFAPEEEIARSFAQYMLRRFDEAAGIYA